MVIVRSSRTPARNGRILDRGINEFLPHWLYRFLYTVVQSTPPDTSSIERRFVLISGHSSLKTGRDGLIILNRESHVSMTTIMQQNQRASRAHFMQVREFDFDPENFGQREEQLEKLQADMDGMRISLQQWCAASYGEVSDSGSDLVSENTCPLTSFTPSLYIFPEGHDTTLSVSVGRTE